MALTVELRPGQQHAIESHPTWNLIAASLKMTLALFTDAEQLQKKYGCKQDHSSLVGASAQLVQRDGNAGTLLALNSSFDDFRVSQEKSSNSKSLLLRTRWVLRDQAKFCKLIEEIKSFIDPLKDLTASISSVAAQNRIITQRIQRINRLEALDLISEVCEIEYPEISNAASQKLNLLSMATDRVHEIADWADQVDDGTDKGLEDILSLDLLELGDRFKAAKEDAAEKARLLSEVSNNTKSTELELRSQLNIYVEKFKEVEDTLNSSNRLFLSIRKEMEEMLMKIKRLERENGALKRDLERAVLKDEFEPAGLKIIPAELPGGSGIDLRRVFADFPEFIRQRTAGNSGKTGNGNLARPIPRQIEDRGEGEEEEEDNDDDDDDDDDNADDTEDETETVGSEKEGKGEGSQQLSGSHNQAIEPPSSIMGSTTAVVEAPAKNIEELGEDRSQELSAPFIQHVDHEISGPKTH